LQRRTGIAQPTIARIESGLTVPRFDTFVRLLEACGESLVSVPAKDQDYQLTRHLLLRLNPGQRAQMLLEDGASLLKE
jgi:hypothetical protein